MEKLSFEGYREGWGAYENGCPKVYHGERTDDFFTFNWRWGWDTAKEFYEGLKEPN